MRPQIPETLEKRAERVYELGGYGSVSELVREAVRRHVDSLEREHLANRTPRLEARVLSQRQRVVHVRLTREEVREALESEESTSVVLDDGTLVIHVSDNEECITDSGEEAR